MTINHEIINQSHIIACATVAEELKHMGVPDTHMTVLEFGLHENPLKLHVTLQQEIDKITQPGIKNIILGYGLCSNAVVGLSSKTCRLVVPKVDDCISIFLGSNEDRRKKLSESPGTFYLTKGWIEAPEKNSELESMREVYAKRYGKEKAERMLEAYRLATLKSYANYTLINTGNYKIDEFRSRAKEMAEKAGLQYRETKGSNRLLVKMIKGEWDSEFEIAEPGEGIKDWKFSC